MWLGAEDMSRGQSVNRVVGVLVAEEVVDQVHERVCYIVGLHKPTGRVTYPTVADLEMTQFLVQQLGALATKK